MISINAVRRAAIAASICAAALFADVDLLAQSADGDPVHVCVDSEGVLRLAEQTICPTSQKSLYFAQAEASVEVLTEPDPPPPTKVPKPPPAAPPPPEDKAADSGAPDPATAAPDTARLDGLERRLTALEKSPSMKPLTVPNRVPAPFEVVDRSGQTIFRVEEDMVFVSHAGQQRAQIGVGENGANLVLGGPAALKTQLFSFAGEAGFAIEDNGKERVSLGFATKTDTYRLLFRGADGASVVAGIGESVLGTGAVIIGSAEGAVKASMHVEEDGKGAISIRGESGVTIASLTEGANGGGLLEISSASGEPMVQAGVHEGGFGVVRAGPASFATGAGLGLPGSFITGRKP